MPILRFQAALTPAIVATITTAEQTFTAGPVNPTFDIGNGSVIVSKPSLNAGVAVAGARISAAGKIGITFVNPTAAGVTPTAGETYDITVIY